MAERSAPSAQDIKLVKSVFRDYDKMQSKTISAEKLINILLSLDSTLTKADLDGLFEVFGEVVDYERFLDGMLDDTTDDVDDFGADENPSRASFAKAEEEDAGLDEEEVEERQKIFKQGVNRRKSISMKPITDNEIADYTKPVYDKSEDAAKAIRETLAGHTKMQVLIGHISESSMTDIVNAFYGKEFEQGVDIIKQGEPGECLYIIGQGSVDIYVARPGFGEPGEKGAKVATWSHESNPLFGELALMYDAPRAATVTAASPVSAWVLDARDFKMLLMKAAKTTYAKYEGWLSQVPLLKSLNHFELAHLADIMGSELYDTDEEIIKQGEDGDKFYILEDGTAAAYILGDDGEKEVKVYEEVGEYFGEVALIKAQPRLATVRATGEGCSVAWIDREDFESVLGPIKDKLSERIDEYPQYAAFLK